MHGMLRSREASPLITCVSRQDLPKCDLLIVLGTSLSVQPFASLISRVPTGCRRLLFNRELVGDNSYGGFDFDECTADFFFEGDTDKGCQTLAAELGWDVSVKRRNTLEQALTGESSGGTERPHSFTPSTPATGMGH